MYLKCHLLYRSTISVLFPSGYFTPAAFSTHYHHSKEHQSPFDHMTDSLSCILYKPKHKSKVLSKSLSCTHQLVFNASLHLHINLSRHRVWIVSSWTTMMRALQQNTHAKRMWLWLVLKAGLWAVEKAQAQVWVKGEDARLESEHKASKNGESQAQLDPSNHLWSRAAGQSA